MDIDAKTLRTFCAVVQTGSFTRAAHRLGYSQSSVTSQMRSLEREIGQQVFQRLPSGVRLTRAGATLRTYARQLLSLVGEMEEALRTPGFAVPRLTIGLAPALAYGEQLARIAHFGRLLLPDRQLALRVLGTAALHTALRGGELDGALLLTCADLKDTAAPPPPAGRGTAGVRSAVLAERARTEDRRTVDELLQTAVQEVEFAPAVGVSRHHPVPAGRRQVVVADPACPSQRWLPEFLHLRTGEHPESLEVGSMDGVHATVQAGLGCAMLPAGLTSDPPGGGLLPLPGVPRMRWTVALLSLRSRGLQESHSHRLAETVRQALSSDPLRVHAAGPSADFGGRACGADAATGAA